MDALIAEVKRLAVNADEKSRRQIMDSLHNLAYSIETPQDTIQRIMYSVRVPCRILHLLQVCTD
jgi:demethylsterigmatocystin 6-O-methyltransferase